jgi:ATP synthase protein I
VSKNQTDLGDDAAKAWGADSEEGAAPWTAQQAQAWLAQQGKGVTAWSVVRMQFLASFLVVGAIALVSSRQSYVLSALYGAMAVVIPNAAMARGISKRQAPNAESAVAAVMLWEMVKVAASVLLLMLATRVVENLSWPALLAGLVVTLKVNWLALALGGQASQSNAKSRTE